MWHSPLPPPYGTEVPFVAAVADRRSPEAGETARPVLVRNSRKKMPIPPCPVGLGRYIASNHSTFRRIEYPNSMRERVMSSSVLADLDFIEELRLRRWARENFVPVEQRQSNWHPVIL